MHTVADILKVKGGDVWSVAPEATVLQAIELMADKDVGALVVLDRGSLVGILSERDYARRITLMGRASKDTLVRDVLTGRVLCVKPERTIHECMALMTSKHVRHLPVVEQSKVVGVVSIGDIVKALISEQQFVIGQLEQYISGG
jgi:CBS domain-containing protein